MRNSLMALLVALLSAHQAHALNLCARIDKASGAPKDGAAIRFRVECRKGEASFGTAGDLAMIRAIRADVDAISEAIDAAHGGREPGRVATVEPATIAKAASGCGLTVTDTGAFFEKCNVHVRSGQGATWGTGDGPDNGSVNGFGNLIVGYDEGDPDAKTGSHNLIVGADHSYPSYGGFVAGYSNAVSGEFSSVSGGDSNAASARLSSVSGGAGNEASGLGASVSGGRYNRASRVLSSISGGSYNDATGSYSSVSGGSYNEASAANSSVSGGSYNDASAANSSVSGGSYNTANQENASVSGGSYNEASGLNSSVSGGSGNDASGSYASVLGGQNLTAGPSYSTIP